jgi:tetratricopeptide (TPR) repeat protein
LLEESLQGLSSTTGSDHPRAISARLVLARIYRRQGNPQRSIELFEECLTLSRVERGIETELAETYLESGDYAKVHTLLDDAEFDTSESRQKKIEKHQRNFLIGSAFGKQKQYAEAIRFLADAHIALSNSPDSYGFPGMRVTLELGRNFSKNGNHDKALETLDNYLENMPDDFGPTNLIRLCCLAEKGLALRQAGKIEEAIETMEGVVDTGVRLRYQNLLIHELRLAWLAAGDNESIERSVNSQTRFVRKRYSDSPMELAKAFRSLGRELIELEMFKESASLLTEAKSAFEDAEDLWNLGTVQFDLARVKLHSSSENVPGTEAAILDLEAAWKTFQGSMDAVFPKERMEVSGFIEEIIEILERRKLESEKALWADRLAMLQLFDA